jgi:hypothetical protein
MTHDQQALTPGEQAELDRLMQTADRGGLTPATDARVQELIARQADAGCEGGR